MSWEPWIRPTAEANSSEVAAARPRRSGPAPALQRTSTARRSGSGNDAREFFGFSGFGPDLRIRAGKDASAPVLRGDPGRGRPKSAHRRSNDRCSRRIRGGERSSRAQGRGSGSHEVAFTRRLPPGNAGSAGKERGGHARGGELTRRLGEARGGEGRGVIGGAPGRHGGSTYLCRDSACERCEK